jgi:hypothetical protein
VLFFPFFREIAFLFLLSSLILIIKLELVRRFSTGSGESHVQDCPKEAIIGQRY